jgi:hypothetical protein
MFFGSPRHLFVVVLMLLTAFAWFLLGRQMGEAGSESLTKQSMSMELASCHGTICLCAEHGTRSIDTG